MLVLTWNLKHGRSVPGSGRDLSNEFAAALAQWNWDIALLQEVPPWWPSMLASRLGASERHVLTSRNALLPVRRAIARRWPDAIKSNGGGCNAILVRGQRIEAHRVGRLSLLPERRWVHAVRLPTMWVANTHCQGSVLQAEAAGAAAAEWAQTLPLILGGDFNVRSFSLDGFGWAGGQGVDHVFVRPPSDRSAQTRVLDAGMLSDHVPILVEL